MIRPKIAFITFFLLLIFLIPYTYIFYLNDFTASIIPGWNTIIQPYNLIGIIVKFLILIFVLICYWKLKKTKNYISRKLFFTHVTLTFPSIIISKFPLTNFVEFQTENIEKLSNDIQAIYFFSAFINIIFLVTQILFFIYYFKIRDKANS